MDAEKEKRFRFRARLEAELAAQQQVEPPREKSLIEAALPSINKPSQPVNVPVPMGPGAVLPNSVQMSVNPGQAAAVGDELLSLPTRSAGAVAGELGYSGATGGLPFKEALASPETGLMRPARQALEPMIANAWAGGQDGRRGLGDYGKLGLLGLGYLGASAIEDPAVLMGGGAKTAGAALRSNRIMRPIEKAAALPNKYAAKATEELSAVSKEALQMASTKEGRAALQANAGKEYEIGQRLVQMMDDPTTYAANKATIDNAVKGMGDVDLMPVVKALQESKIKRPSGKLWGFEEKANQAIQDDINALLGSNGRTKLSAAEALDLRRGLDKGIDFGPEGKRAQGIVDAAKKKARLQMKNILEAKAKETGKPEYVKAMEDLHKQFDARDRLEQFLGANKDAQEDRAQAFISNLWGKNKRNRQKIMDDIGNVFGKNFLEESRLANLAAQLGDEGKAAFWSRSSTGRSKLGGTLTFPFSSPLFASRVTLPLARLPENGIKWLRGLAGAKNPAQAAFYTENLKNIGMDDGAIQDGLAAIKNPPPIEPPPAAGAAMVAPPPTKPAPASSRKFGEMYSPETMTFRRNKATKYLTETTGKEPDNAEVYRFLETLGDKPVPIAPKKEIASREFNGRRDARTLDLIDRTIKHGLPDYPTKTAIAKDAPQTFELHGSKFRRVKGKWDNMITYKDDQGRIYEFRGDETIHMDYAKDEVPF